MANKPLKFIEHEIADNIVLTNKKPDTQNVETILFGASKVTVGVATSKEIIKVDPITGLNYLGNQIDAQQIYNLKTQRRGCYFYLDLETGRNNNSWYPGSKRIANVAHEDTELHTDMSDESELLAVIPLDREVEVLQELLDDNRNLWNKVKYENTEGYIRKIYLSNFRYVDREI